MNAHGDAARGSRGAPAVIQAEDGREVCVLCGGNSTAWSAGCGYGSYACSPPLNLLARPEVNYSTTTAGRMAVLVVVTEGWAVCGRVVPSYLRGPHKRHSYVLARSARA